MFFVRSLLRFGLYFMIIIRVRTYKGIMDMLAFSQLLSFSVVVLLLVCLFRYCA